MLKVILNHIAKFKASLRWMRLKGRHYAVYMLKSPIIVNDKQVGFW